MCFVHHKANPVNGTAKDETVGSLMPGCHAGQGTACLRLRCQSLRGGDNGYAIAKRGIARYELPQMDLVQNATGDAAAGPAACGLAVVRECRNIVECRPPEIRLVQQPKRWLRTKQGSRAGQCLQKLPDVEERMVAAHIRVPLGHASQLSDAVFRVHVYHQRVHGQRLGLLRSRGVVLRLCREVAFHDGPQLFSRQLGGHPQLFDGQCLSVGFMFSN
mmetsp:Transcript_27749/g.82807  ORF Transcript_27749/g.82807 Transcript_27749/m.82807 type:complete len:217 (+) Transcript_27749:399-1049(+)